MFTSDWRRQICRSSSRSRLRRSYADDAFDLKSTRTLASIEWRINGAFTTANRSDRRSEFRYVNLIRINVSLTHSWRLVITSLEMFNKNRNMELLWRDSYTLQVIRVFSLIGQVPLSGKFFGSHHSLLRQYIAHDTLDQCDFLGIFMDDHGRSCKWIGSSHVFRNRSDRLKSYSSKWIFLLKCRSTLHFDSHTFF